jgi:peptidoglycan/LPS O-acetylase OafA/YrhL
MYLVLPALFLVTQSRRPLQWTALICVVALVVAASLPTGSYAFKLLRFVPCFLPGMLAYVLRRQGAASPWLLGAVTLGGVLLLPALAARGLPEIPLFWGFCLALGVTIPHCRQVPAGILARGGKLVATYSYGVYITHVFALGMLQGLMPGPWFVQWAAMLIMLPGLAYLCYHGIEKRGIALGARLALKAGRRALGTYPSRTTTVSGTSISTRIRPTP